MTEQMIIENGSQTLLIGHNGSKVFVRNGLEQGCFSLKKLAEFDFQLECGGERLVITEQNCSRRAELDGGQVRLLYEHALFDAAVTYDAEEGVFRKRILFTAHKPLTLRYAHTEFSKCDAPLRRGGEGQPIFINNFAFMGIEFPTAVNKIVNDTILLEQAPFIALDGGESYSFYPVVYGIGTGTDIEVAFLEYIRKNRVRTRAGLKVYGDWAAHDELSDSEPLDEKMAMRLLRSLEQAKEEYDVVFDSYLMDAFWYEEKKPYTEFKKSTWPNGVQPFLAKLKKSGYDFGLWFDVNMEKLELEGYTKRDRDYKLCLADPKVSNALFDGIEKQMKECGLASIKLDFAYFDCENPGHTYHSASKTLSKEPAARNFLEGVERLKKINPELLIFAYNGFTTDLKYLAYVDGKPCKYTVSPWWLFYLNYIYCGDPRPSEVPTKNLSNSIIYYTDAMIAQFAKSLIPYEGIDDHGTMVGKTGTIYSLKAEGFYDSWIMNISRGGQKLHLYGETDYLTDQHWRFIRDSYEMFDFTCRADNVTKQILGAPNNEKPYGYSNSNGLEGYLTLVNCSSTEKTVSVALEEWKFADNLEIQKVYAKDHFLEGEHIPFSNAFSAVLPANSVCVYRWNYRVVGQSWEGVIQFDAQTKEALDLPEEIDSVTLCFSKEDGTPLRTSLGIPDEVLVRIDGADAELRSKEFIWSGISWVKFDLANKKGTKITVWLENTGDRRMTVKWQAGMKGAADHIEKSL